jgi:hypothetical protein
LAFRSPNGTLVPPPYTGDAKAWWITWQPSSHGQALLVARSHLCPSQRRHRSPHPRYRCLRWTRSGTRASRRAARINSSGRRRKLSAARTSAVNHQYTDSLNLVLLFNRRLVPRGFVGSGYSLGHQQHSAFASGPKLCRLCGDTRMESRGETSSCTCPVHTFGPCYGPLPDASPGILAATEDARELGPPMSRRYRRRPSAASSSARLPRLRRSSPRRTQTNGRRPKLSSRCSQTRPCRLSVAMSGLLLALPSDRTCGRSADNAAYRLRGIQSRTRGTARTMDTEFEAAE